MAVGGLRRAYKSVELLPRLKEAGRLMGQSLDKSLEGHPDDVTYVLSLIGSSKVSHSCKEDNGACRACRRS